MTRQLGHRLTIDVDRRAGPRAVLAAAAAAPSLLPTFAGLAPGVRNDVVDQLRAMQAEHQMYSDWAARALDFFDAHQP